MTRYEELKHFLRNKAIPFDVTIEDIKKFIEDEGYSYDSDDEYIRDYLKGLTECALDTDMYLEASVYTTFLYEMYK